MLIDAPSHELAPAEVGLYIHVPFCIRKCSYCTFFSLPATPSAIADYLDALAQDLSMRPRKLQFTTVFLGGGTPTCLPESSLVQLLELVAAAAPAAHEWSIEANPGTLTRAKARHLRALGVTRVSLGIQSLDATTLRCLGRGHDAAESIAAWNILRDDGPPHLGLDLIYGVPGLTRRAWEKTLAQVLALQPEHISAYCLSVEPETPLARAISGDALSMPHDATVRRQYEALRVILADAGYEQYEISNFARPGAVCRHNMLYWSHGVYWACGPAACGHWHGYRFALVGDLDTYCRFLRCGRRPLEYRERLLPRARAREALLLGLRRTVGWSATDFHHRTGFHLAEIGGADLQRLIVAGWIEQDATAHVRLAPHSYFISNAILAELA